MPIEIQSLLNAETIVIVAVLALTGLVALVLLQGLSLRRRVDEMLQEDTAAHATLRTAADRVARIEAETTGAERDELSIVVPSELRERLGEVELTLARRGGVAVPAAIRVALERGLTAFDAELRQPRELAPAAGAGRDRDPYVDRAPVEIESRKLYLSHGFSRSEDDTRDRWAEERNGR